MSELEVLSRTQIDKLGDALRTRDFTENQLVKLDSYRRSFGRAYDRVVGIARHQLKMEVTGRPSKSTTSIIDKLERESARLSQVQDIAGCRVVVDDIPAQDRAVMSLEAYFRTSRTVNRRTSPSHGYRAVHVIATYDHRSVEVQVRTTLQHYWAEISEKLADTVDQALKYGAGNEEYLNLLRTLSDGINAFEKMESDRAAVLWKIKNSTGRVPPPVKRQIKLANQRYEDSRSRIVDLLRKLRADFGCTER